MKLSTPIDFPDLPARIGYSDKVVLMGSCFSEHIGSWLSGLKFNAASNTAGIAYNPVSIARHIGYAMGALPFEEAHVVENEGQFVHCDFHSSFNQPVRDTYLIELNKAITALKDHISIASVVFLTFGTSIAFRQKSNGMTVNNCHKLPSTLFQKRMLDEGEMKEALQAALDQLWAANPNVKVVLTVSPIRHLRHGAVENQRSKARLIRLCEMLCGDNSGCSYLPTYEYVMDELRDYRFYRHDDMIHLNELGLEMIREKVREHVISPDAFPLMTRVEKWNQLKKHRIMKADTPAAMAFSKKIDEETAALEKLLPGRIAPMNRAI